MRSRCLVLGVFGLWSLIGCEDLPTRSLGPDWMHRGKLAGLAVHLAMTDEELEQGLDALVHQHVDVVIGDSSLSNYLTDAGFDQQVEFINHVAKEVHRRGMKLIWYLTSLEVQTVDGKNRTSTMAKDHPDWLQVGMGDKKNVFYGSQEVWVEGTDESAWMCPVSGYRDYFTARVRKLATSSLDGIWVDVPLFMDTGVKWSCRCPLHQKKFKAETGLAIPAGIDCGGNETQPGACATLWKDPAWRAWIQHRHHDLNEFQLAVAQAARAARPGFEVVFEVFTMDYNDAMDKGLDGTFMGNVEGVSHAWEIDSVSNGEGMLRANLDDWIGKIALTKFARGADKRRPTWAFAYGNTEWDAGYVMAILLAGQANPYETKTPQMATTVGAAFRKRIYTWADSHLDAIYGSRPAARVALLYSSHSRDYLDYSYGFAMFSSTTPPSISGVDPKTSKPYQGPDEEWWSDERRDSVTNLEFLGEYRGFIKLLVQAHVPFAVEALQHLTLADLRAYDTVIAPNVAALSDPQAALIADYVREGGDLIITGPRPTALDDLGNERAELALAAVLGFGKNNIPAPGSTRSRAHGAGSVHYLHGLPARQVLRNQDAVATTQLHDLLRSTTSSPLRTNAAKGVYLDLYRLDAGSSSASELVVHLVNLEGVDGTGTPLINPQTVRVELELPPDHVVERVLLSSPDETAKDQELTPLQSEVGLVAFDAKVTHHGLARVKLKPAPSSGKLELGVAWPTRGAKAPPLSGVVRVTGQGLLGPRIQHFPWGTSAVTFDALPPGEKQVRVAILDESYREVAWQSRLAKLELGSVARLQVSPGVSAGEGPSTLAVQQHDAIFFVNGGVAPTTIKAGSATASLDPGQVYTLTLPALGKVPFTAGSSAGTVTVGAGDGSSLDPRIETISEEKGYAGHSVIFRGRGFGRSPGEVLWGSQSCTVSYWSEEKVTAYLPHAAAPGAAELSLVADGRRSKGRSFSVLPPGIKVSTQMADAFAFIKKKMRSPEGGVYTNLKDQPDPPQGTVVYPYGHHQTAEHMGLMLWMAAALLDHQAFEESFQFVARRMVSLRRDVVNWAVDKTTGVPMLQRESASSPWLNSNAPLDDFRVLKGLVSGWMQWKDERYLALALRIGNGLSDTSVSTSKEIVEYPGGLVAYAYNWPEEAGLGITDLQVIPIDYADLWAMKWLAERDSRWKLTIDESIKLMERAQHASGQFYNSYLPETKTLSGDFEYRDTVAGQKVKSIQSLWIAIHLARAGRTQAAQKALQFYKTKYQQTKTIAEYMNFDGSACTESYFDNTLKKGEARIYSQLARLAYYLGDRSFADQVITEKILTDQDTNPSSPTFGSFGKSTVDQGDAEAWNTLESLVALTLQQGSPVVSGVFK